MKPYRMLVFALLGILLSVGLSAFTQWTLDFGSLTVDTRARIVILALFLAIVGAFLGALLGELNE